MKKRVVWCGVFLVLLIITACSEFKTSDLPPEPAPPASTPDAGVIRDIAGQAIYPYEVGFSSPFDVYEEDQTKSQLFFVDKTDTNLLTFEEDTFAFPIRVRHTGGVIYKYGYVWSKTQGWVRYEFPQKTYRNSNWIVDNTDVSLTLNRNDLDEGANWVVAYSCKKYAGKWRCGMQQKDGTGDAWMLQTFQVRNAGIPNEPAALTNQCTDTDGGKKELERGTATGVYIDASGNNQAGSATDECVGTTKVKEWYCDVSGTVPLRKFEEITCANGCSNGACLAQATAAATTFTVCRVPLRGIDQLRPAHLASVTDATAEQACANQNVFGKADGTAFVVTSGDLSADGTKVVNEGQVDEKLECALPCAAGREAITKCKDIASTNVANPYYRNPASTCP